MSHPESVWGAYERLQADLARRDHVDDRAWGLEAGLNSLLTERTAAKWEAVATQAAETESRKCRHRARLRRLHLASEPVSVSADVALHARLNLSLLTPVLTRDQWILLLAVSEGYGYQELAGLFGVSVGALRVRVLRLRARVRAHAA